MKIFSSGVLFTAATLACILAAAQGTIGNGVPQSRVGPAKKLTVQECADRRASATATKKDVASVRQDRYCARLLKNDAKTVGTSR